MSQAGVRYGQTLNNPPSQNRRMMNLYTARDSEGEGAARSCSQSCSNVGYSVAVWSLPFKCHTSDSWGLAVSNTGRKQSGTSEAHLKWTLCANSNDRVHPAERQPRQEPGAVFGKRLGTGRYRRQRQSRHLNRSASGPSRRLLIVAYPGQLPHRFYNDTLPPAFAVSMTQNPSYCTAPATASATRHGCPKLRADRAR